MTVDTAQRFSPRSLLLPVALLACLFFAWNQAASRRYDINSVNIEEARSLIDSGALVIDVREESVYNSAHIPNAISVPLAVLRMGVPATLVYAREQPIVVYCGNGASVGPEGTAILNRAGFVKAVNIKSGLGGWRAAGLPVRP